ncbi:DeoR/GlpR family DNA-binding transcription regulator [Anaerocolumna sp. MB42-C2]|uniref:DeoR/GlpR family DNA-binding transcription regulator n=1 Tax=Anaerocolumna sp. MB42-C2 TaxID=3070997 RepID=UPI0027E1C13C|nr:DeoR/GlpR family DNA-binding transcription regulator [Anaerocolumna sp. MB42-C2]WMJ88796.1 DeoR/GlpR family DNA-binding transcription regulator [Anaerocolumna sp. MB42-C2]
MLAAERHSKIIQMISETGAVQVEELAKVLDVSLMTIRRDLEKLNQDGIIERCHGGAIIKREVSYMEKRTQQIEDKIKIAEKCAGFVKKGDATFLDAGTTTYEIAKRIQNIPGITVITNDLEIARLLLESDVRLMLCGGMVQKSTGSMLGPFANQMMEDIRTEIAFLGAMSIDDQFNVLTPTLNKAVLKRTICKNSRRPYLAADETKFGKQALMRINHLSDYAGVVTNKSLNAEEEAKMKQMKINMILV